MVFISKLEMYKAVKKDLWRLRFVKQLINDALNICFLGFDLIDPGLGLNGSVNIYIDKKKKEYSFGGWS